MNPIDIQMNDEMQSVVIDAPVTIKQDIQLPLATIKGALGKMAFEQFNIDDDAGLDWYTDDDGNTYIAHGDWRASSDPHVARLVDAYNILRYGELLKLSDVEGEEGR